jgi:hypothetical protein
MNREEKQMERLIKRYVEGLTSLDEEQTLRNYFLKAKHVPGEWEVYRAMFRFFGGEIARLHNPPAAVRIHSKVKWIRWSSISAAACLLLFFSMRFYLENRSLPEISLAYINGKKYTNIELIRSETLKALTVFSEEEEDMYASQIEALNLFFE